MITITMQSYATRLKDNLRLQHVKGIVLQTSVPALANMLLDDIKADMAPMALMIVSSVAALRSSKDTKPVLIVSPDIVLSNEVTADFETIMLPAPDPALSARVLAHEQSALETAYAVTFEKGVLSLVCDVMAHYGPRDTIYARAKHRLTVTAVRKHSLKGDGVVAPVSCADVLRIVAEYEAVSFDVLQARWMKQMSLEAYLEQHVVGQPAAIKALTRSSSPHVFNSASLPSPLCFLFAGSEGVGKHKMAENMACYLHGDARFLIRLDMRLWCDVSSLEDIKVPSPTHDGLLSSLLFCVKACPTVVFEIEHVEQHAERFMQLFAMIFETGQGCMRDGSVVDFRHTCFVLSTTIGSDALDGIWQKKQSLSSATEDSSDLFNLVLNKSNKTAQEDIALNGTEMLTAVMPRLTENFPTFFLSQCRVIPFSPLSERAVKAVLHRSLEEVAAYVKTRFCMDMKWMPEAETFLYQCVAQTKNGARSIHAVIEEKAMPCILKHVNVSRESNVERVLQMGLNDTGQLLVAQVLLKENVL